jgi:hypothetical protein
MGGAGGRRFREKWFLTPTQMRDYKILIASFASTCKGTDLSGYTQCELNAMDHRLNMRPRKCLGFATPLEVYAQRHHDSPVALGT